MSKKPPGERKSCRVLIPAPDDKQVCHFNKSSFQPPFRRPVGGLLYEVFRRRFGFLAARHRLEEGASAVSTLRDGSLRP